MDVETHYHSVQVPNLIHRAITLNDVSRDVKSAPVLPVLMFSKRFHITGLNQLLIK